MKIKFFEYLYKINFFKRCMVRLCYSEYVCVCVFHHINNTKRTINFPFCSWFFGIKHNIAVTHQNLLRLVDISMRDFSQFEKLLELEFRIKNMRSNNWHIWLNWINDISMIASQVKYAFNFQQNISTLQLLEEKNTTKQLLKNVKFIVISSGAIWILIHDTVYIHAFIYI